MSDRIAVITPGGDASGMNSCIRAVVRKGLQSGYEMFGIYRGYEGLINGEIFYMPRSSVSGIIHVGGTILKSTRCEAIKTPLGMDKAVAQLKKMNIDHLVVIGGDGSLTAGCKMTEHGINVIGIPASIDNDVYGTEETIGFDTAIDVAIDAIDKIRDTATSFERIFIVEVMGREHGFLTLAVGIASGAEFIVVPEVKMTPDDIVRHLKEDSHKNKRSMIIVFAEGVGDANEWAKQIEKKTGISTRYSKLGYIQRGGAPSGRSRILGSQFGAYAIELIKKGVRNKVVVIKDNKVTHIPIDRMGKKEKTLDMKMLAMARDLAS